MYFNTDFKKRRMFLRSYRNPAIIGLICRTVFDKTTADKQCQKIGWLSRAGDDGTFMIFQFTISSV